MSEDGFDRLLARVVLNRHGDPATSYVAKLTGKGRGKIAQKLGEEAVETVIAAMGERSRRDRRRSDRPDVSPRRCCSSMPG